MIVVDEYAELADEAPEAMTDTDSIARLGQGMLASGWHAHTLNAPGKFLISAPEHTTPRRPRAYLVNDDDVTRTAQHFAASRPQLDEVSRGADLPDREACRDGHPELAHLDVPAARQ